ncbi:hypothetical protein FQR65_LT20967 [Abscondita terminalis]|nr:hypothetical protein FQR65_LT20967 [Abscondita terminalis]
MTRDPSKVALVTGAGRGIGLETTRLLLAKGYRVVAADDAISDRRSILGGDSPALRIARVDVTDYAAMQSLFDSVETRLTSAMGPRVGPDEQRGRVASGPMAARPASWKSMPPNGRWCWRTENVKQETSDDTKPPGSRRPPRHTMLACAQRELWPDKEVTLTVQHTGAGGNTDVAKPANCARVMGDRIWASHVVFNRPGGASPASETTLPPCWASRSRSWLQNPSDVISYIQSGRLRLLASASPVRWPEYPDVPTLKEAGFDVEIDSWLGWPLPSGTPDAACAPGLEQAARGCCRFRSPQADLSATGRGSVVRCSGQGPICAWRGHHVSLT